MNSLYSKLHCMENDSAMKSVSPGLRAAAYWFVDGLPEIASGVEFAAMSSAAMLLQIAKSAGEPWTFKGPVLALFSVFFILVVGGDYKLIEYLKSRLTYVRTGYVRRPKYFEKAHALQTESLLFPTRDENITQHKVRTVPVMFGGSMLCHFISRPWGLPVSLGAFALALCMFNRNTERTYHWRSMLLLPVAGLLMMPLGFPERFIGIVEGVWLAGVGAWRLFGYLRRNPRPQAQGGTSE